MEPKICTLIDNCLEKSECGNVAKLTKEIAFFKAIEKLKQWISIHLNEELFFEELKTKRFKKRNDLINESKINNEQSNAVLEVGLEKLTLNLSDDMPSDLFNHLKVCIINAIFDFFQEKL